MSEFFVAVGNEVSFAKTIGESDVYLFAGITGDFAANHVNEEFMRRSAYGRRIAHGALLVGYMSRTSTMMAERAGNATATPVSLGFDMIRFLAPAFIGDTVTLRYRIDTIDPGRLRAKAKVTVENQDGTLLAVAEHILKWVPHAAKA